MTNMYGDPETTSESKDNGGRRLRAKDRRQFLYSEYFPERRCGQDRRKSPDRRRLRKMGW